MADEYGETTNYNLRFPKDKAPIDTAGDIKRLAEDVDGALPRITYGTGRPDSPAIAGTEGDKYICTDPDSNFGAREWRYTGTGWRVIDGCTPSWQQNNFRIWLTHEAQFVQTWGTNPQTGPAADALWSKDFNQQQQVVLANNGAGGVSGFAGIRIDNTTGMTMVYKPTGSVAMGGFYARIQMGALNEPGVRSWPTTEPTNGSMLTLESIREMYEEAAKDNPELAEQLKAELEALEAERNG